MIIASNQKGFSLIFLIVIMLTLAGLGAAIYSFTTSTSYTELSENNRNRAYQLAVAGMNYAAERYAAGVHLNDNNFKNKIYTLVNRGQITYTVTRRTVDPVTGYQVIPYYDVVSTGTVNENDGLLLARAQVRSSSGRFPYGPPANQTVISITMDDINAFKSQDLKDAANHPMVKIEAYMATGGTHMYWAAFTDLGTYPRTDGDNAGCPMGFHTARVKQDYANDLRHSWETYGYLNYDLQTKVGWYMGLQAAVSGLSFRWHETAHHSGLFEGYGLAFMRYTYSASGCGVGYDYIPNSIKPPGLANKLLLVLWEQRLEGGVEKRRWLAYADLGTPAIYPNPRAGNDLKVVGAQDGVDGLVNDNSLVMVRIKDVFIQGQRANEINVFYGDASPYYDGVRTPNVVATDITRKRMFPEWIRSDLFPSWPSNKFGEFEYPVGGNTHINNFWFPTNTTDYDFFTLVSASDKIGLVSDPGDPNSATPGLNPVQWIINPTYADPRTDTSTIPTNTDLVTLLRYDSVNNKWYDKATLRTYKFVLNDFNDQNLEVGLHGMGNLNNSDRIVAFDDLALQILGR
jgi:hypothetical protein